VIVTAAAFGRDLGKTVIVVRDRPGFWVNRILAPYLNEAGRLLTEGATVEAIDAAMTGFGFPVGPITLQDEVGLDVAIKASSALAEAFGARMHPADGLSRMVQEGRLGRKSDRGFYRYREGKKLGVDPAVYATIGAARPRQPIENIEERLVFIMLNEAVRALDEGIVRSARDGDVGAVLGIGFPPFRGGPFRYLDKVGAARAVELLEGLRRRHGERFAPAALLTRMAERSSRFYKDDG
jgi:3-hydroxyacyl-CoA dehydrogenase/enoyl-CoA hydratase/3-hydroxybutyryl-CoA epimerase